MMKPIEIYEVGPRDGFQSVMEYIPLNQKLQLIDGILTSGIRHIQITSFVSPKAIPQMKDAQALTETCVEKYPGMALFALVPNLRGAEMAWNSGLKDVSYVSSLSESHNKANTKRTHEETLVELKRILTRYPDLNVCLDLATAFGCPFEGKKDEVQVVEFIAPYVEAGIRTVNLCDTIGIANPGQVRRTIKAVKSQFYDLDLLVHIHDTRNMGMVNTLAAVESGVTKVQSALGGLGGCPFAPGASGNLATEDLVFMLEEMGYPLGVNIKKLVATARKQAELLRGEKFSGHLFAIGEHGSDCR